MKFVFFLLIVFVLLSESSKYIGKYFLKENILKRFNIPTSILKMKPLNIMKIMYKVNDQVFGSLQVIISVSTLTSYNFLSSKNNYQH